MSHAPAWTGLEMALAVTLHTLAMLAVMGLIALVVYKYVGLSILRRAWIQFDLLWAFALLATGSLALLRVTLA